MEHARSFPGAVRGTYTTLLRGFSVHTIPLEVNSVPGGTCIACSAHTEATYRARWCQASRAGDSLRLRAGARRVVSGGSAVAAGRVGCETGLWREREKGQFFSVFLALVTIRLSVVRRQVNHVALEVLGRYDAGSSAVKKTAPCVVVLSAGSVLQKHFLRALKIECFGTLLW